jgi:hypothetical protein
VPDYRHRAFDKHDRRNPRHFTHEGYSACSSQPLRYIETQIPLDGTLECFGRIIDVVAEKLPCVPARDKTIKAKVDFGSDEKAFMAYLGSQYYYPLEMVQSWVKAAGLDQDSTYPTGEPARKAFYLTILLNEPKRVRYDQEKVDYERWLDVLFMSEHDMARFIAEKLRKEALEEETAKLATIANSNSSSAVKHLVKFSPGHLYRRCCRLAYQRVIATEDVGLQPPLRRPPA